MSTAPNRTVSRRVPIVLLLVGTLAVVPATAGAAPGDTSDLSASGAVSSPGVKVGGDLAFRFTSVNLGPDAASNVAIEVVLDSDLTFRSAAAPGGSCTVPPAALVCTTESLDVPAVFAITVTATTTATGQVDVTAATESDSIDAVLTNNVVTVSAMVGPATAKCDLWGTAGPDAISGSSANEVICGFAGNDRLSGGPGNDRILGGPGNDVLLGGAGRDHLIGGPGKDTMNGGAGRDRLVGGPGKDRCRGKGDAKKSC